MKYIPKTKGLKLGLYNDYGMAASVPQDVKVRFDTTGEFPSFQFFDDEKPITPILIQLQDEIGYKYTGLLRSGLQIDLDLANKTYSEPYVEKLENVKIGTQGEILIENSTGKLEPQPYVLDKKRLKKSFENSYLLNSLIGVKGKNGRCAIFDSYTKQLVTDFVLDSTNYGIVDAINLDTQSMLKCYYIVQTSQTETADKSVKKFIIASEKGEFITELNSAGYLWNFKHIEKKSDGTNVEYAYVAFADKKDDNSLTTRILKINLATGRLEQETRVPLIAEKQYQNNGSFIFTPNNNLVVITHNPENPASKGAYVLNLNGTVERLLENTNTEISYSNHYNKGNCLIFKNAETVGKVALNEKARTFEVSKTDFARLAKRYFGASSASEASPKTQAIQTHILQNSKNKPEGENNLNGQWRQ